MLALATIAACTPKEDKQVERYEAFQNTGDGDNIQRMRDYRYSDTVRWKGRLYTYEVVRRADDSLAVVTDDDGSRYADNYVELTVRCGDENFFHRRFTKQTFMPYLDADFKKKGLLEGMAFDKVLPEGIRFSISVSYPFSDMCRPFSVTLSSTGGMSIIRDEVLDNLMDDSDTIG